MILLVALPLLDIELDEVGILLDLVFSDTHGQELLQQRLPRGIRSVNCRASRARSVRVAVLRGRCDIGGDDGLGLVVRGRVPVSEQPSKKTVSTGVVAIGTGTAAHRCAEGLVLGVLVCILFPFVHLLLELLGFLLVAEGQGS